VLHFNDEQIQFLGWAFGSWLAFLTSGMKQPIFPFFECSWNLSRVDGLRIIVERWIWYRLRKSDQNPNKNRSSTDRLSARFHERLITRSCCFISRLSATMAFAPPGPKSLARVVNRCMSNKTRSFMIKQGRADYYRAQDLLFVCFLRAKLQFATHRRHHRRGHPAQSAMRRPCRCGDSPGATQA